MVKEIIWTKRALADLDHIIEYLQEEWTDKVAESFVVRVYHLIELIAKYPEMGTIEVIEKQIRGFVITKHSTLFYRVESNKMTLLSIFDNRRHPQKKKF